jgi:hypothetical protein
VHHPYDSFALSHASFMANAADDPAVALKSTVYRAGEDTPLAPTLDRAAENGNQVVRLIEIKARRRAAQHQLGSGGGAGRGARRLRPTDDEDLSEDDARRPA